MADRAGGKVAVESSDRSRHEIPRRIARIVATQIERKKSGEVTRDEYLRTVAQAARLGNSLIYLIHIHKTAGTSIRMYFEKCFGRNSCFWHGPNRNVERDLLTVADSYPDRFGRFRAIGGHVGFAKIPKVILDKSPIFVSALRDPVARIISHYQHIRSDSGHGIHQQVVNKTLFQAMKAPGFAALSDGFQIMYLCGRKDLKSLHDTLDGNKYIIGKQEKIDDLFHCLSTTFGFPVFQEVRVNVSKKQGYEGEIQKQEDYAEAVELIRRMNSKEYEFYNSFEAVWSNI